MAVREIFARGIEAVNLATTLLQRCRLADPFSGVFEAADVQWSWRIARESDEMEKVFWMDSDGPVAGVWVTNTSGGEWQVDPIIVPQVRGVMVENVWDRVMNVVADRPNGKVVVPVSDDDAVLRELARASGLIVGDKDFTGWINAEDRLAPPQIADGFSLVDCSQREGRKHPLEGLNGDRVARRLQECLMYDPWLDLSIESTDGQIAGYSLYWFDPVTKVGLVEPVRVHDAFQRKGLALAMVIAGIARLVAKGADRIKVSWETEAAGALYLGVGFQEQSTTIWYSKSKR